MRLTPLPYNTPLRILEAERSKAAPTPTGQPLATIASLVFNRNHYDTHLSKALEYQDAPIEVLIEENADNHISLGQFFESIISRATADLILLVHPDIQFSPWAVRSMVELFESNPNCGAAGMIGVGRWKAPVWSNSIAKPSPVSTLDGCAIMLDRRHGLHFDVERFNGFHCLVEDYCLQVKNAERDVVVAGPFSLLHESFSAHKSKYRREWMLDNRRYTKALDEKWSNTEFWTITSSSSAAIKAVYERAARERKIIRRSANRSG